MIGLIALIRRTDSLYREPKDPSGAAAEDDPGAALQL
jgi:hypothetical protein